MINILSLNKRKTLRNNLLFKVGFTIKALSALQKAMATNKFDLTSDEILVEKPVKLQTTHKYSDEESIKGAKVSTYSFYELLAEKIGALFERTRPRDLYDVVTLFQDNTNLDKKRLKEILKQKCHFKKIDSLSLETLKTEACESGWSIQLSHQLADLPAQGHF